MNIHESAYGPEAQAICLWTSFFLWSGLSLAAAVGREATFCSSFFEMLELMIACFGEAISSAGIIRKTSKACQVQLTGRN